MIESTIWLCFDCCHDTGGKFRDEPPEQGTCTFCKQMRLSQTFTLKFLDDQEWEDMKREKSAGTVSPEV